MRRLKAYGDKESLNDPVLYRELTVVRLGDHNRPATVEDIKDMRKVIEKAMASGSNPILVTHHAVEFETIRIPVVEGAVTVLGCFQDDNEFDTESPITVQRGKKNQRQARNLGDHDNAKH